MKKNIKIDVHHLTRVEGHGNIKVNITDGIIEEVIWKIPESPRFFEAMVLGRHYSEVARITSRICGICSVGHTLASVKASEQALGIVNTSQTEKLRNILKHAENFDSHILHTGVLVAPDLLGAPSVFSIIATQGETVATVLRLKRLGHEWGSVIAGRTTHPTTILPGGFSKLPSKDDLLQLKEKIIARVPDLVTIAKLIKTLVVNLPDFNRPTEYMALHSDDEYGLLDGIIQSTMPDGTKEQHALKDYLKVTNEWVSPNSTAKFAKNKLDSYAVGAMARFNNNYDQLHPEAKKIAEMLEISPIYTNPFYNTVAQVVECVHSVHEALRLIDEIVAEGIKEEKLVMPTKFSKGIGATEVPRGILFHDYEYDNDGMCINANCIIPTNQNHANIQLDFDKLVPEMLEADKSEDEMRLTLEMLVRAYDPCISCSTHYLDVEFIKR